MKTSKNITLQGVITLESTLAHGAFHHGGIVTPFRREPILQREADGAPALDDYALETSDPAKREMIRQYAQRILRIIWQSKSDNTQWTYSQLADRVDVAARMCSTMPALVEEVGQKMDAGHLTYFQDDAEFLAGVLSATDSSLLLNLLREPGERLLIVTRMQAESAARYEKRDLPAANGQISLFASEPQEQAGTFKVARVPYIPLVPVYSGNALRNGVVRRNAARFILDRFGWRLPIEDFRSLFVGGALVRTGKKGTDIDERRRLVELMPAFGLLGGPFNTNSMIEGCAKTGKCWPVVREAIPVLPPGLRAEAALLGMRNVITTDTLARREDARTLGGNYLTGKVVIGGDDVKSVGMVIEREVLIAGTRLSTEWVFYQVPPLQLGAWVSGWVKWAEMGLLGGAAQIGNGRARVEYTLDGEPFLSTADGQCTLSVEARQVFDEYKKHLDAKKNAIGVLLNATEAQEEKPVSDKSLNALQDQIEASEED